ncbi:protein S100-A9-like [Notamacropus eugenii]|uniref:protein S100-A9-like n=1 Tax=Notamacropus eugenii TaxID=9315 RepID=UPI003B6712F5
MTTLFKITKLHTCEAITEEKNESSATGNQPGAQAGHSYKCQACPTRSIPLWEAASSPPACSVIERPRSTNTMEKCTLKNALKTFVDTFHQYSQKSGHPDALERKEMKQLLTKEMAHFIKNSKELRDFPNLMVELDTNVDQLIDFKEFAVMIARVVMETHEKMHECNPLIKGHHHGPGLESKGECGSGQ